MTQPLDTVIQCLEFQAGFCERSGSPFTALVARAVAADIERGGAFAELAAPWAGRDLRALFDDAVALRFVGGLHYLVLAGDAPTLAVDYPPMTAEPDRARLVETVAANGRAHQAMLAEFVTSPPQTNEVNRSVGLSAGFLTIARRTGLPLRCLEIGASAGLNMNWDRYAYDVGPAGAWGDPASPVRLGAEWEGPPPPLGLEAKVIERRACDQNPVPITTPREALRLKAFVWPDQTVRMERLYAAIEVARQYPPLVDRADAADWVRTHVKSQAGAATVLYHSVVWPYLPAATQGAVTAALDAAGESARPGAPLAWLRMEPNPADPAPSLDLKLTLWPNGEEILLAHVDPHGAKVSWLGD